MPRPWSGSGGDPSDGGRAADGGGPGTGRRPGRAGRGLLASAAARPTATAFGQEAYPTLEDKAAALLHSLARNHALLDGNKRLALAGTIAFLGVNGLRLTASNDEAHDLIMAVAAGVLDEVPVIAARLGAQTTPR